MIDFSNFHKATVANWVLCEFSESDPDYVSFTGSAYWDCGDRVKRSSDHWGNVRSCRWLLDFKELNKYACGECFYEDFRPIRNLLELNNMDGTCINCGEVGNWCRCDEEEEEEEEEEESEYTRTR